MRNIRHLNLLRSISVGAARLKGTGLPRLSEALRRRFQRGAHPEVEIHDFRGNLRLTVDLREHMGSRIFWFDSYSEAELALLSSRLGDGDVFVDVGANIGEFTLPAARAVGGDGKVVAIEPVPAIRDKLNRHIAMNGFGDRVIVVDQAVGDRHGSIPIYGPSDDAAEFHGGLPTAYASAERPVQIAQVPLTTLDALIGRLALTRITGIKLDIEGAELPALKGGLESLRKLRPWLICEIGANTCEAAGYAPGEVLDLLLSLDYRVSRIDENGLHPILDRSGLGPWQNVFAEPR